MITKKLFLLFSINLIALSLTAMQQPSEEEILLTVAQKLMQLRNDARCRYSYELRPFGISADEREKNQINSVIAYQEYWNACTNEYYTLSEQSKKILTSLGLFDIQKQTLCYREIVSKNIDEITNLQKKIFQGYLPQAASEGCTCLLQ